MDGEGDLAAALLGLKERSGLSYQQLGSRVFTSSSTLHRYCSGKGVPGDFDLVLRIARECGADPSELSELLRRWEAVTGEGPTEPGSHTALAPPPSAIPPAAGSPQRTPAPVVLHPVRSRRASRFRRLALFLGMALFVLTTAIASTPHGFDSDPEPVPTGADRVPALAAAASWARPPAPVDPELFGVTMNSYSGAMPSFRVGALRLWDSETRWSQLEPRRGEFDWTTLDRLLEGAGRQGL
ncbi:helix-turn-helix domain-containing protein, partial [Streptomyces sp. NPDC059900]